MTYDWNKISVPIELSVCPIEEAVLELRYETDTPREAVFGILYSTISDIYPTIKKLPIMELPDAIRANDPAFSEQPHYQVYKDDKFSVMIGPKVISLISKKPYAGWTEFSGRIRDLVARIETAKVVKKYSRLGLRYINQFDVNIFKNINLSVGMNGHVFGEDNSAVRLSISIDGFSNNLRISNTRVSADNAVSGPKSVIDIDTILRGEINGVVETIEKAHQSEKKLFFSLLTPEFIKTLGPRYK